jgi:hypothetical protein
MPTLLEIFPDARELLALEPEDLAGVLIELLAGTSQSSGFMLENLTDQFFAPRTAMGMGRVYFRK